MVPVPTDRELYITHLVMSVIEIDEISHTTLPISLSLLRTVFLFYPTIYFLPTIIDAENLLP
jgi:hypothetical protein